MRSASARKEFNASRADIARLRLLLRPVRRVTERIPRLLAPLILTPPPELPRRFAFAQRYRRRRGRVSGGNF